MIFPRIGHEILDNGGELSSYEKQMLLSQSAMSQLRTCTPGPVSIKAVCRGMWCISIIA